MDIPRRILIGVDFSDYSKEALADAAVLAKHFGADLYLFHAFDVPAYYVPSMGGRGLKVLDWLRTLREDAHKQLEALAWEVQQQGVKVHPTLKEGVPFREIPKAAKEMEADLIVLGTHGRTGLDRFLMGSVAEEVARRAPCPILLIKPKTLMDQDQKNS